MEDIARFAVDYAGSLGSTYSEARIQKVVSRSTSIKNGEPQFSAFLTELGIGIRLIINGALVFTSTNELTKSNVIETVLTAATMARIAAETLRKPTVLSNVKTNKDKWEVQQKQNLTSVSIEDKLKLILEADKCFKPRRGVKFPARILTLSETINEQTFLNSEGTFITSKIPRVAFSYIVTGYSPGKGTVQRFNKKGESAGWEAVSAWNLIELASEEADILVSILNEGKKPPKNVLDVVLGSEVVGIVSHESCGHPFEADRILGREAGAAGESFVSTGMLGKRIGSSQVTVVDDPTIPQSYGYHLYDDEGVKVKRRELIRRGIVNTFLHNRETSAELGIESNGAARTISYSREPIIRMSNTYMDRGDHRFEELLESIPKGVYIKSFMEWNIDDRRFSQRYVGLEAYLIKKGKLAHLVRNPVLEITTPRLYESVDAVGRDLSFTAATCGKGDPQQGAPVWTGGPDIRLRKVRLGGL